MKPSPTDRKIGAAIRKARRAKELSQAQLGEEIGKTYQQVQKYEAGTNRVSVATFLRICEVLGLAAVSKPILAWLEESNR
jgi:transcriptional regulator with XRE-family HTH domain